MLSCLTPRLGLSLTVSAIFYCSTLNAQLVFPEGWKESLDDLTAAVRQLTSVLNDTNQKAAAMTESVDNLQALAQSSIPSFERILSDTNKNADKLATSIENFYQVTKDHVPQLEGIFNETNRNADRIATTIENFYGLAEDNVPAFQEGLEKGTDSLASIAGFGTTVQENSGKIVAVGVGALASGIVIGVVLANHFFILDKNKNVFAKVVTAGHSLYRKWRAPAASESPIEL